ncbi:acyl-CoA thioesterase II [Exophiala oligosperma]|uniref:Acyl-CoA thioesterase II n=1 Tax=Exophiala oligosperma TaxID=215243 RepID=A0A0D2D4B0_9EURO|nr:acyl-CoA thioesterase II [Exophiala oligosperma]KIW37170.1 acyl-CoA thioesterase II [Exophiala oligosperma]
MTTRVKSLDFESHIELEQIGPDTFTNVHPPWVFPITHTMPGPLMMAEATAAAYRTVTEDFRIDSLQVTFMLGPKTDRPLIYKVQRLSQGRTFVSRLVNIEQDDGRICVTVTASFVRATEWTGRSMTHTESMKTTERVGDITLDDFEGDHTPLGPFMKFQRLPHLQLPEANDPITTTIGPVVAKIDPPIKAPAGSQAHLLGIIYLSDYHIMDCPLRIHDIPLGLFPINDRTRTKQPASMKIMTSLNHAIHFHVHDGFRADELVYVEATTPWAKDGRALIHSRIFSHKGLLIATCVQEAFYVFKDNAKL